MRLLWVSPRAHACPDACEAWVDPWEEPNRGPGPGTLQVGQMDKGCLQCPSCCGSCPSCFAGAEGQTRGPRCSFSSCNRCSKAEQELQQLVLPALPEHVATLGPEFWDGTWQSWWSKEAYPAAAPPAPPHSWGQLYVRASCRQVPLYVGGSRRNSSMLNVHASTRSTPHAKDSKTSSSSTFTPG